MLKPDVLDKIGKFIIANMKEFCAVHSDIQDNCQDSQSSFLYMEIDDYVTNKKQSPFSEMLFRMIQERNLSDSEVYKRAGIDRRLFSKIRSDLSGKSYHPGKSTVIALILALELDKEKADLLLSSAGYSLSYSSHFDLVIIYCLEYGIYNLIEVNEALDHFDEDIL